MSDLRTLLRDAAGTAPVAPAATTLDGDLRRGRRALAARRARWAAVPAGLLVVSATAVLVPGSPFAPQPAAVAVRPAPVAPGASDPAPTAGKDPARPAIELVAYTGAQPVGYTIDKVPDGWKVQAISEYSLVIAPVGAKDTNPDSFVGKIMVGKANAGEVAVQRDGVTPLKVGKVTAKFFTFPDADPVSGQPVRDQDQGTLGLLLPVGRGNWLIFQIPGTLHWDAATVADFAAGVHMTGNAKAAAG